MYTNYCDFMPQAPDGTTWEFYRTYRYPDYERVGHCYRYVSLPKNRQGGQYFEQYIFYVCIIFCVTEYVVLKFILM